MVKLAIRGCADDEISIMHATASNPNSGRTARFPLYQIAIAAREAGTPRSSAPREKLRNIAAIMKILTEIYTIRRFLLICLNDNKDMASEIGSARPRYSPTLFGDPKMLRSRITPFSAEIKLMPSAYCIKPITATRNAPTMK